MTPASVPTPLQPTQGMPLWTTPVQTATTLHTREAESLWDPDDGILGSVLVIQA